MNRIENYIIADEYGIHCKSRICSVACSIGLLYEGTELHSRISELIQSYYNQWRLIVETYQRLRNLFESLNENSDKVENGNNRSDYFIFFRNHQVDFRVFSYLLIIGIKTHLDLLACIVEITLSQKVTPEHKMIDFFRLESLKTIPNELRAELIDFKSNTSYKWLSLIQETRNQIVHRGYTLRPVITNKKSASLLIRIWKETDSYKDSIINIGEVFDLYMTGIDSIEDRFSKILIKSIDVLNKKIKYESSFRYYDSAQVYSIDPIILS
ncbi:MAG: hypothetical protein ACWA6U_07910 [Breznakibacter sp.]